MLFTFRFTIPATSPSAYLEARIDQVVVTQPVHDISHINSAMESLAEIKASQLIASAL